MASGINGDKDVNQGEKPLITIVGILGKQGAALRVRFCRAGVTVCGALPAV